VDFESGGQYRGICKKCGATRIDSQIGLEPTPEAYVEKIVAVFAEVWRVLRDDGTCWVNLGDSYAGAPAGNFGPNMPKPANGGAYRENKPRMNYNGLKPKDLVGIPWMVAKALQSPRYTGKITNELDRVWLAAMIDAEGTICGFTHVRKDNGETRQGIHITVTNSNTALLDKCFEIWETTREKHNAHGNGHLGNLPTWRWIVHSIEEKSQLLAELYPYFVGKKKQAILAWNFLEISKTTRGRNKGDEGRDNREKYAWIVDALSRLNHLEPVDIPSWCKEPPSQYTAGWYLRSDIIWSKPNPMPESVTDRPTKAHEYIFLLTKRERYYFDQDAVREPANTDWLKRGGSLLNPTGWHIAARGIDATRRDDRSNCDGAGRNIRTVWEIATQSFPDAHFATFPEEIAIRCIKAGSKVGDTILDPFSGAGTVPLVADKLNRRGIGLELKLDYVRMASRRCYDDAPLLGGL
jgi:DNA modification methylase